MNWSVAEWIGVIAVLIAVTGVAIWWLFIASEGVYLGRRVVIWLYDIYAARYDSIKRYDKTWEAEALALPILAALGGRPAPLILDVATGTGRLPLAMLAQPAFRGRIIGLDLSRRMLQQATLKLQQMPDRERCAFICQDATKLPFNGGAFDLVSCLEALEFMPAADPVIAELARVLRPGGVLLITNRKGTRMMPGKLQCRDRLLPDLEVRYGLREVHHEIWQVDYELVWARKPGRTAQPGVRAINDILICPRCARTEWDRAESVLRCEVCSAVVPIGSDGVIEYAHSH